MDHINSNKELQNKLGSGVDYESNQGKEHPGSNYDPKKTNFERKNSLLDENPTAGWFYNVLMKEMDKYAFARAMLIFCFCSFFLGNNLSIFIWIFIISTCYLLIYRVIRFWTKRYLLYMMEFCYFGNAILLAYLIFLNKNKEIFSITFICNTGIMTIAVIVFNNQTQFNSTDHLTSTWIHTLPLVTNWAIRWRHIIYSKEFLKKLNFEFLDLDDVDFKFNKTFLALIIYPLLFWTCWAIIYSFFMGVVFSKWNSNPKYFSGLTDFKDFTKNSKFFGDVNNYTILKYLFQHFSFLILMFPVSIFCFYNFYFNTIYIIFIMVFLFWNTARNNIKHAEKQKAKGNLIAQEF